jgi:hypothetical protein
VRFSGRAYVGWPRSRKRCAEASLSLRFIPSGGAFAPVSRQFPRQKQTSLHFLLLPDNLTGLCLTHISLALQSRCRDIRRMRTAAPNFTRLDSTRPEVSVIIAAMLQARQAVERRSWVFPQEPTDDCWWADVLSDRRARNRRQPRGYSRYGKPAAQRAYYMLADEPRPTISVACTKCEWKAEFSRAELIAMYGADYA